MMSFLCAGVLAAAPLAVRFIPSRYVARFVPAPLQAFFQPAHTELPTPASRPHAIAALLTPVPTMTRPIGQSVTPPADPLIDQLTPTPQPANTSTPHPVAATATPVAFPNPTIAARSTPAALDSATVLLTGFRHTFQTWNNCGPANLTMALSYYGWQGSQAQAAAFLKPDPEDRNVSPDEMAAFARSQGFEAIVRADGTLDLLKALVRAGLPPIVEKGFEPEQKLGWMGHYELVIGWEESAREFIVMDSYLGPNQAVPFDELDKYWRQFNWTYIVVYQPEQAGTLAQILGADMDDATMYHAALARAQAQVSADPNDAFSWFDVGTNLAALNMFDEAASAYDQARRLGLPWRMTWYQFGWFEAYLATNRLDDVTALADVTLKNDPYAEEMYFYKGLVFQQRGDTGAAREQFDLALAHNPNFVRARLALEALR